jgi:hypothetical protein
MKRRAISCSLMTVVTLAGLFWFSAATLGLAFGGSAGYSRRALSLVQTSLFALPVAVLTFDFFLASYAGRTWRYAQHVAVASFVAAVVLFLISALTPKNL